ncbi:hypothetical protein lerEdw1_005409 [Lerista edwardsae]|nr:hypothetical protein lerEdw1_005409 [Lerista edwardsae]
MNTMKSKNRSRFQNLEEDFKTQSMGTQHRTKVDVPDHVLYTVGSCVLVIGSIGITGNLLVLYAFCRKLTVPGTKMLLSLKESHIESGSNDSSGGETNCPFTSDIAVSRPPKVTPSLTLAVCCNLYAFCGALFGITSMMTLLAISVDRYCVITRPLQSIKRTSKKRTCLIILFVWLYSLGWSVCPLFGWTIRSTGRNVQKLGSTYGRKSSVSQSIKNEWKLAKIAFVAIVVFVVSWSPYACVTLIAWAGRSSVLNPYSKSVPAVIAKASAIYNPIIYAIIHPRYRRTIRSAVPCLRFLIRISKSDLSTSSMSESSFRTSMTRYSFASRNKSSCVSSISAAETAWNDVELDPMKPVHKKQQPYRSNSLSIKAEEEKSELLLNAHRCNVATGEKVALSSLSLEEPLGRSPGENPPELLLISSCLRASSLPFGLNSSSTWESTDTSQAGAPENQINGGLDSFVSPTLPQIVVIPTSETTLSETQVEQENGQGGNSVLLFPQEKNRLLDTGRLSSSIDLLETIEKLLS